MKILAQVVAAKYLARLPSDSSLQPSPELGRILRRATGEEQRAPTTILGCLGAEARDLSRLTEPVHRTFVNTHPLPESILQFTRRYGPLEPFPLYQDGCPTPDEFLIDLGSWKQHQQRFRSWWGLNQQPLEWEGLLNDFQREILPEVSVEAKEEPAWVGADESETVQVVKPRLVRPGTELAWERRGNKLLLVVTARSLWQYLCLCLMAEKVGTLRFCENPNCGAPYFVARRRDQAFCGSDCSELIAKRRWWANHGEDWRRKWRAKKKKTKGARH